MTPFWAEAKADIRSWDSPKAVHKQGWIREGCLLRVIEVYGVWYQIDLLAGPHEVKVTTNYPEIWVEKSGTLPADEPVSSSVSDAEAAAAFLTLVKYIKGS